MRIQSPSISKTEMAVDCKRVFFLVVFVFQREVDYRRNQFFILDVSVKWSTRALNDNLLTPCGFCARSVCS